MPEEQISARRPRAGNCINLCAPQRLFGKMRRYCNATVIWEL